MKSILQLMRLLSESTRLRIVLLLQQEELTVAELQEILGMGQPRISTTLAQLRSEGIVIDRRAGKNSYYKTTLSLEKGLQQLLEKAHQEIPEAALDKHSLKLILKKRHDKAHEYFNKLANQFGHDYIPGRSWQALAEGLIGLLPPLIIADLGAGEGTLSQLLARSAKKVIAIDNNPKMVVYGKKKAQENGFDNLDYRKGNIESPPITPASVDLVVISQVLRHLLDPLKALEAAHRILKPGGKILLLDLLHHHDNKISQCYGHCWPGFSSLQLHHFLKKASFGSITIQIAPAEKETPQLSPLVVTAVSLPSPC